MNRNIKIIIVVAASVVAIATGIGIVAARGQSQASPTIATLADGNSSSYCEGQEGMMGSGLGMMGSGIGMGMGGKFIQVTLDRISSTLGMTPDDLKAQLKDGKTLLSIAKSKEVSQDKLVQTIVAPISDMIDVAVKYGYFTSDEGSVAKGIIVQKVTDLTDKDLRETLSGGAHMGGMMGPWSGQNRTATPSPSTRGRGMMGSGMMGNW
ncbi:MAG: hypothetical protein HYX87_03075 [Chloroflexi bacterium]|nr:hypothetical protein [Chloroflexota bacterium]